MRISFRPVAGAVASAVVGAVFTFPSGAAAAIPCDQNRPPSIGGFMHPSMITENNHKYAAVQAILAVADDDSGPVTEELVSATSSEADHGLGQGDKPNDIVQVDTYNFLVRAELGRGSTSRTYSFTYRATDGCGASSEATLTVTVQPRR